MYAVRLYEYAPHEYLESCIAMPANGSRPDMASVAAKRKIDVYSPPAGRVVGQASPKETSYMKINTKPSSTSYCGSAWPLAE